MRTLRCLLQSDTPEVRSAATVTLSKLRAVETKNGFDPDSFSEHWDISVEFPKDKGYGREHASEKAIQTGLLTMFVQKASWLFYDHIEKKYPDV